MESFDGHSTANALGTCDPSYLWCFTVTISRSPFFCLKKKSLRTGNKNATLNGPGLGQLTVGSGVFIYQLGLRKQRSTGKVKLDEVFTSGRHFIGPDYTFKTFNADAHFEELKKIVTFSKDKVEVEITCAMQYFLRPEDLKDMHQEYDLYYRLDLLLIVFSFLHNLRQIFKNCFTPPPKYQLVWFHHLFIECLGHHAYVCSVDVMHY